MDSPAERLLSMGPNRTGAALRRLREDRGLSLRELSAVLFSDYSWLGNVEHGRRWPKDREWITNADVALGGGGVLVSAWDADRADRAAATERQRLLRGALQGSEQLLVAPDATSLDGIGQAIVDIATKARLESYDETLRKSLGLRSELLRRLQVGAYSTSDVRDLHVALGRVSGVLSYLTLDLGRAHEAKVHAEAAFRLGDKAGHDQLRAWARGTQALAFRFTKDFQLARNAAEDGLNYVGKSTGTSEPRLLCGLAASIANLGDSATAVELLEKADRAREYSRPDEIPGLFTFTPAKQVYYHGFSLMWAEDPRILHKSVKASEEAMQAWKVQRSPGDEMLTTIYLASANARLGDLDASLAAVAPVLDRPVSAHFSWVRKRLTQLNTLLGRNFTDSKVASDMRLTLDAYVNA